MSAIKPRDAASLVLLRDTSGVTEVLMGRRHSRHAFIPDAFVFPGGKLDADDRRVTTAQSASSTATPATQALEAAAIRETFEETGLLLACPGDIGTAAEGTWGEFRSRGLVPDAKHLRLLARAITPAESPIRFHARFFTAHNAPVTGEIKGSGELLDLAWYPLDHAKTLPVIDVTEFVLKEISERTDNRTLKGPVAFWRYRSGTPILSYEA
ncbi:MAG: NUDIX domain-containing protein [Candidatus Phaeomarinobacter sp.]